MNSELVKTPTFKRWFGDSKVVDADGRPLVVYHGSDAPRESFEPAWRQLERDARPSELVGNGSIAQTYRALKAEPELHFFSEERGTAESYGEGVTEAYLSVQRPVYAADRDEAIRKMLDTDADGARFEDTTSGGGAGGMVWVVRRSTQVKSATQNSGAFDPQDARLNYSNDVSPIGFYSELARKVEGGPGRAMADQWRAYINGLTTKGVKADEIAWTGVQDWLALQTGKVSKAQVAEFLKGNGVQVHETVLGSPAPGALPTGWTVTESDEEPGLWEARDGIGVLWGDGASREAAIENSGANARTPVTNTKYQDYTLPGGTNYREVLLTLPRRAAATQFQIKNRDTGGYIGDFTSSAEASEFLRNGPRADEFAAGDFTVVARESQERGYRSSHWDQPNVLAHVRVNDRIDTDGKRVLFVEELQSDWGQTGKKDGFKTNLSADTHEVVPMRTSSRSVEPDGFGIVRIGDADQTSEDIYDTLEEANAALMRGGKSGVGVPAAPFVGKTESWLSLGLKRVIKMAVDEGYARVAFVNGEQSSERYDLSKQIDSLEYKRNPAGGGHLQAFDLDGEKVMDERLGADHELEGLVGKEVAKKILAQEPMTNFTSDKMSYVLNDAELKVGGEGMAIFYDKIVPNTARDVLKKLGGGPLVQMQLDTPSDKRARLNEKRVWSGPELSVGEVRRAAANPSVTVSVREQLDAVASAMRFGYSLAEAMQREASMSAARALGGDMVVPPGQILTQTGFDITDAMREHAGEGLPMFSNNPDPQQDYAFDLNSIKRPEPKPATRATDGWILSRDALGNFRFGAGQKLYDVVSHLAGIAAAKVGMKPMSTELRRAIRQMNLEVSRSQAKTAAVATEMAKMSPEHRAMISDIIEQELEAGVTPPAQVLHIAATISGLVSQQTDDLIAVGMLSPEAADKWRDRYLPRFYESKLKGTATDAWDKAVAMLSRKPTALKGIGGKSLKRRGMTEVVDASQVKAYQDMGWTVDDKEFDPAVHTRVQMHRDFTRPERERMGEIRDSMFRFVMGYSRAQKDLALGRLYEHLADTIGSRHELPGHVKVPDSIIDGTDVNTYGKLAGMWVPQEVLSHLTRFGEGEYEAVLKIYRKGLGMWKEGKTVLNPVSHANNVVSNLTMAHFGGVSYWDAPKYIAAMRDFVSGGGMLQEAKDAGLFGGTISEAELMSMMPKELQILSKMTESQGSKNVEFVWNAMSLFLRKPMGAAYQAEDLFFRHLLYREARNQGLHANDAVDYAQRFIFTYDDLPRGARMVRDTALPFFSYTYKVAPVLAHTALAYPWRYAAPWAAITALNTLMYAIAQGHDDDDDWKESIRKYVTDASFRDKVREKEKMERKDLPPWMKGDGFVLHTPKTVRLGMDDLTHLPVFLDISRFFPGGDLLDMNSNTGGVPWLQNLTPSSPLITTMGAMMWNRDPYFGKDIVDTNDTSYEASLKRGQWLWQQFAPAISVNNYVFNRSMNAVAQATGSTVTWWPEDFTGIGKDGLPIQPKYAAMQNIGIKARPIDLDASARMEVGQRRKMIHDIEGEIRGLQRLRSRGAVSEEQAATKIDRSREKIQRLRSGLDVDGNPKE